MHERAQAVDACVRSARRVVVARATRRKGQRVLLREEVWLMSGHTSIFGRDTAERRAHVARTQHGREVVTIDTRRKGDAPLRLRGPGRLGPTVRARHQDVCEGRSPDSQGPKKGSATRFRPWLSHRRRERQDTVELAMLRTKRAPRCSSNPTANFRPQPSIRRRERQDSVNMPQNFGDASKVAEFFCLGGVFRL